MKFLQQPLSELCKNRVLEKTKIISSSGSITKSLNTCAVFMCVPYCTCVVCVPLITLNLFSVILGRKWASAALGRKTAFGRSPRVHWEGRGQRISVSPRHGTGCEEIVGNANNRSNRGRAAASVQQNQLNISLRFMKMQLWQNKALTFIKLMHPFLYLWREEWRALFQNGANLNSKVTLYDWKMVWRQREHRFLRY